MTATKAHMKATKKYEDKAYFKTLVRFQKEDEDRIRAAANEAGNSLNGYIVGLVMADVERMEKEKKKTPDKWQQYQERERKRKEELTPLDTEAEQ